MPDPSPNHAQFLPDVYRYAFLMTGSAVTASEVLRSTLENAPRSSDDDRKPGRTKRWLFTKAREFCRQPQLLRPPLTPVPPASAETPAPAAAADTPLPTVPDADDAASAPNRLAAFFAVLPEEERSALILFYLYLFSPAELAEVLEIKIGELGPLLSEARTLLQQHKIQWASLLAQSAALPVVPASD